MFRTIIRQQVMGGISVHVEMTERKRKNLASIFNRNREKLFNFIRKRVNEIEVAEDILQDVFYRLANGYEAVRSVDSWLFSVTRNRIKDYYRSKGTANAVGRLADSFPGEEEDWLFSDEESSPEEFYTRDLIWDLITEILEELPEEQKQAFTMHELDKLSINEIAKIQGVNENTVLSRKRYAVLTLRSRLIELYEDLTI